MKQYQDDLLPDEQADEYSQPIDQRQSRDIDHAYDSPQDEGEGELHADTADFGPSPAQYNSDLQGTQAQQQKDDTVLRSIKQSTQREGVPFCVYHFSRQD